MKEAGIKEAQVMERQTAHIKEFVENNVVKADDSGSECPDGRYTAEQSKGKIRIFGADIGVIMAVRAAINTANKARKTEDRIEASTEDLFRKYSLFLKTELGDGAKITFHTDDSGHEIGCGHIAKAASGDYEEEYGVSASEAQKIWDTTLAFENNGGHTQSQELKGEHKEKGVLLVRSNKYSVNSRDPKQPNSNEMYFVVDTVRTEIFLQKVASNMGIKGVDYDLLSNAYDQQVAVSARLLAPGKPQYSVTFSADGAPKVEYLSIIQGDK